MQRSCYSTHLICADSGNLSPHHVQRNRASALTFPNRTIGLKVKNHSADPTKLCIVGVVCGYKTLLLILDQSVIHCCLAFTDIWLSFKLEESR